MIKPPFYGWKLLAALWCIVFINLAFPVFGSSVINAWMAADLHLDRQMLGLPYTVFIMMIGLPGPLVAYCIHRTSIRFTLLLGGFILLLGSLLMATYVTTGIQAVLAFGLVIGFGVACGSSLSAQAAIARWFLRKRALALSIVLSAPGIGGFFATRLMNTVITANDGYWQSGWWLMAGLTCITLCITALFVRESPASMGQQPDGIALPSGPQPDTSAPSSLQGIHPTDPDWSLGQLLRSRSFRLILLCALGYSPGFMLLLAHGMVHLQDLGHSPEAAAGALSLMSFCTLVGNFLSGLLGDRADLRRLWIMNTMLCAVGILLVINAQGGTLALYPFAICVGIGFGGSAICMMTLISNYYGARVYASAVGLTLAVQTTLCSAIPLVAGSVFDHTGSYAPVLYSIFAWGCFCAMVLFLIRPDANPGGTDPRKTR